MTLPTCDTCGKPLPDLADDPTYSPHGVYFCGDECFYASPERGQE